MIGDVWWLDTLRWCGTALAAVSLVLLGLRARRAQRLGDTFAPWATAALTVFGVFVIIQELEQIGHRFVPWRLPLLMVGSVLSLIAVSRSEI